MIAEVPDRHLRPAVDGGHVGDEHGPRMLDVITVGTVIGFRRGDPRA
jgi:hypothetical protein